MHFYLLEQWNLFVIDSINHCSSHYPMHFDLYGSGLCHSELFRLDVDHAYNWGGGGGGGWEGGTPCLIVWNLYSSCMSACFTTSGKVQLPPLPPPPMAYSIWLTVWLQFWGLHWTLLWSVAVEHFGCYFTVQSPKLDIISICPLVLVMFHRSRYAPWMMGWKGGGWMWS